MKAKHLPQQIHVLLAAAIFLTIVVLAYQISVRHNRRLDLTRGKVHSLTNEMQEILDRMREGPMTVRSFFAQEDPARRQIEVLLKQMAAHHPDFRYQFYDPDRSPSEAERFQVDSYRTSILEYEDRKERVDDVTEQAFANALIRLSHPQARTLCFTTGHGEVSFKETERTGFSEWKKALENRQYQLREIQLTASGVSKECDVVLMAGPHYELLPKEIEWLQKLPGKGKSLLLLIDPMDASEGKSFVRLLEPFGLRLGPNVVVDKVSRVFGGDFLVPMITQYGEHPVTQRFRAATFLPIARTVAKAREIPAGVQVTELAHTTEGSWAETDLKRLENGEADFDPKTDFAGPLSLAAAVEISGSRVAVVGDSDFLINAHLGVAGNRDFSFNLLDWLAKDDRWISVQAKELKFEPFFLRADQSVGAALFALGILPFSALGIGSIRIWFRRRKTS